MANSMCNVDSKLHAEPAVRRQLVAGQRVQMCPMLDNINAACQCGWRTLQNKHKVQQKDLQKSVCQPHPRLPPERPTGMQKEQQKVHAAFSVQIKERYVTLPTPHQSPTSQHPPSGPKALLAPLDPAPLPIQPNLKTRVQARRRHCPWLREVQGGRPPWVQRPPMGARPTNLHHRRRSLHLVRHWEGAHPLIAEPDGRLPLTLEQACLVRGRTLWPQDVAPPHHSGREPLLRGEEAVHGGIPNRRGGWGGQVGGGAVQGGPLPIATLTLRVV